MLNGAEAMRARALLRRHWRATIAVGVFAGVAAGLALGAWGIARRTSTVYDRFVDYEGAATLSVFGCPEGITDEQVMDEYGGNFDAACGDYDYADLRAHLRSRPEVVSAGRFTLAISQVAPADRPDEGWRQLVPVAIDDDTVDALGASILVDGRLADPDVAADATINEEAAERLGVGVGDELVVTPYRRDEFDVAGEGAVAAGGIPSVVDVVGITRRPTDLARRLGRTSIYEDASTVMLGPAWWASIDGDVARYGVGLLVTTAPGTTNDDVIAAVRQWSPDRNWQFDVGPALGQDNQQTIRDAIELQAVSLRLVAALVGLAALLFAGQAVARQSRTEWSDADALVAIGMNRTSMSLAAAMRASVTAAVAVAVAALVVIGTSSLGPFGAGRSAEPSPGVEADVGVLAVGLPVVALLVIVCSVGPVVIRRARPSIAPTSARARAMPSLPASGVAGVAMARTRRSGSLALGAAVTGVVVATTVGVAAWTLLDSYDELVADPARYGSTWDAQVGNVGSAEQDAQTRARLSEIDGITAAGLRSLDGLADNPNFALVAAEPFIGDPDLATLVEGRLPTASTEIALGRTSRQELDLRLGDEFVVRDPGDPSVQAALTIVGEVVVNSGYTNRPGVGGMVTNDFIDSVAPEVRSQVYAVWIDADADREETLVQLRRAFPTTFVERSMPTQVSNLGLVSDQPVIVALVVALLAGAALTHALMVSVRRSRRDIGVLRSIGFTRRQVITTVGWYASLLSAVGLAVGIPIGVVAGRVAWRTIVDDLGVVAPAAGPFVALLVVAFVVLAVANVAALAPAVTAARTSPAVALRAE